MTTPLKVPALGESVSQATVGAWLKQEGEAVAADEPHLTVDTTRPAAAVLAEVERALSPAEDAKGAKI
jgi:2-oxoglutarate dehydrogenase E2 component (dihydrolipoamide succinyltransferase)